MVGGNVKKELRFICGMILLAVGLSVISFFQSIPALFRKSEEPGMADVIVEETVTDMLATEPSKETEAVTESETEPQGLETGLIGGAYAP